MKKSELRNIIKEELQAVLREKEEEVVDYRGEHTAPKKEGDNSIDNPTDVFPSDIYGPSAVRLYSHGSRESKAMDEESIRIIQGLKGSPEKEVTIYRAVPKGVKEIKEGDWVSINRDYAADHGESHLKDGFEIIEKKVKAKELATDGNSIHEWGYSSGKKI